jgi:hypothetical protein
VKHHPALVITKLFINSANQIFVAHLATTFFILFHGKKIGISNLMTNFIISKQCGK